MSINMKHSSGTVMAADRHVDMRPLVMDGARFCSDLTESERVDARAAIDDAMQSVGQVLEAALQVMGNLRTARAALVRYDDGPPVHAEARQA
ncbi:hypothetical protein BPS26883_04863 [Burkholderia pseudomultivorans]|uniref:Uncharacterized protein n=1 Tax=Burkholderia pseudomultivorans TaxID=1207504 RepID=A0A6P2P0Q6_9BURK|nr:hypothetical protein [Burkholderia pseudomultivorans]VWC00426.1 hypothetical protein BPS26883_04863 [Burkholderia pseudomultivorans]